jgi:hypothetical protein
MSHPSKADAMIELQRRGRPVEVGDAYQVAGARLRVLSLRGEAWASVVNARGGGELLVTRASLLQGRLIGWGE